MIDLRGIISISGHSGLFKVVSQTKFGLIVESIADGKRMPAYSSQRISALEDISVFTTGEDIPLAEVFQKIAEKENKGAIQFDAKSSNDELRKKLENYLPNFDKERVYASDIKKLFSWYNLLQSKDLLKELKEDTKETVSSETKNIESSKEEDKPKAKKTAKAKEEKQEKATKTKAENKEAAPKKTTKKATKDSAKEEGDKKPTAKAKKSTSKKADK